MDWFLNWMVTQPPWLSGAVAEGNALGWLELSTGGELTTVANDLFPIQTLLPSGVVSQNIVQPKSFRSQPGLVV